MSSQDRIQALAAATARSRFALPASSSSASFFRGPRKGGKNDEDDEDPGKSQLYSPFLVRLS